MFLSKRSNGYYYIYYRSFQGKRVAVSTKTKIKKDAIKFIREYKEPKATPIKDITITQFFNEYLKYSEAHHTWKTTLTYHTTFNKMKEYYGECLLGDLSQKLIDEFIQSRIRKKSLYAARKDLINIKAAFRKAVEWGLLNYNPAKNIKRIKLPEKLPVFFSRDEFNKLIEVIDEEIIRDIVIVAVNTGMRQMEILSLIKSDVDIANQVIILSNRHHITKSKRMRKIPLNSAALQILKSRILSTDSEFVFEKEGRILNQDYVVHKFKKYIKVAKLNDELSFHSLRHTFASWLVQAGVQIYNVSKLLGHADIKITEIYSHLRIDDLQCSVGLLDD